MIRIAIIVLAGALLGGCQNSKLIGSIAGGECQVFERPQYAVRGHAVYDQRWIDRQIEGGVGACKWKRPEARPAEIERATPARAVPARRPSIIKRLKAAVMPKVRPSEPVAPMVTAPPVVKPEPPCAAVDKLLHRCGSVRRVY